MTPLFYVALSKSQDSENYLHPKTICYSSTINLESLIEQLFEYNYLKEFDINILVNLPDNLRMCSQDKSLLEITTVNKSTGLCQNTDNSITINIFDSSYIRKKVRRMEEGLKKELKAEKDKIEGELKVLYQGKSSEEIEKALDDKWNKLQDCLYSEGWSKFNNCDFEGEIFDNLFDIYQELRTINHNWPKNFIQDILDGDTEAVKKAVENGVIKLHYPITMEFNLLHLAAMSTNNTDMMGEFREHRHNIQEKEFSDALRDGGKYGVKPLEYWYISKIKYQNVHALHNLGYLLFGLEYANIGWFRGRSKDFRINSNESLPMIKLYEDPLKGMVCVGGDSVIPNLVFTALLAFAYHTIYQYKIAKPFLVKYSIKSVAWLLTTLVFSSPLKDLMMHFISESPIKRVESSPDTESLEKSVQSIDSRLDEIIDVMPIFHLPSKKVCKDFYEKYENDPISRFKSISLKSQAIYTTINHCRAGDKIIDKEAVSIFKPDYKIDSSVQHITFLLCRKMDWKQFATLLYHFRHPDNNGIFNNDKHEKILKASIQNADPQRQIDIIENLPDNFVKMILGSSSLNETLFNEVNLGIDLVPDEMNFSLLHLAAMSKNGANILKFFKKHYPVEFQEAIQKTDVYGIKPLEYVYLFHKGNNNFNKLLYTFVPLGFKNPNIEKLLGLASDLDITEEQENFLFSAQHYENHYYTKSLSCFPKPSLSVTLIPKAIAEGATVWLMLNALLKIVSIPLSKFTGVSIQPLPAWPFTIFSAAFKTSLAIVKTLFSLLPINISDSFHDAITP